MAADADHSDCATRHSSDPGHEFTAGPDVLFDRFSTIGAEPVEIDDSFPSAVFSSEGVGVDAGWHGSDRSCLQQILAIR